MKEIDRQMREEDWKRINEYEREWEKERECWRKYWREIDRLTVWWKKMDKGIWEREWEKVNTERKRERARESSNVCQLPDWNDWPSIKANET